MIRVFEDSRLVTEVYCVTKDEDNKYRLETLDINDLVEGRDYRGVCSIQEATDEFIGKAPPWSLAFKVLSALDSDSGINDDEYEALCKAFGHEIHDTLTEALEEFLTKDGIQQRGSE